MISEHNSNIISNLRLPLMVMVVFIHSYLTKSDSMPTVTFVEDIFSKCIPIVAVPTFMFISGYLYFAKFRHFTLLFYKVQTLKRIRTLLVPYIIWNTFVICVFWSLHRFAPTMINPDFENIQDYTVIQLLDCYWRGSGGFPIAYQFWFIRDLFIITLVSPLIYLIAKSRYLGIAIVMLLLMSTQSSYIEMGAYFFMGAYCSINNVDFSALKVPLRVIILMAYIVLAGFYLSMQSNEIIRKLLILCGSISLLNLKVLRLPANQMFRRISSSAFFLFCMHGILDLFTCKILTNVVHSESQLQWIMLYFINVTAVVLICMAIYFISKKISPRLLRIVTGNR